MHSSARARAVGLVATTLASGCVYPATEPTGMEVSWRFVEHGLDAGEDAPRVRTCAGAMVEQVAVEIHDQDTPVRHGIFRFDCIEGYQTVADLQTEASDAFVRLDPGLYDVTLWAVDDASDASNAEALETREVEVEERGVTLVPWEAARAPVTWRVELRSADACEELALALYYADPEADLANFVPDGEQSLPLYRAELRSDRDLPVGGQTIACDVTRAGLHVFEGLDRDEYLLEIVVDGGVCSRRVSLAPGDGPISVIDLANLSCAG